MVVISTVDSSLTPCDCSGWRCQPNALNFKDFISCKKLPPHFKKPMCLLEDAEECNLQPFGSRRWRRKKGFSTASHLQHEQNASLLCSSVHHKTNVNRKVLKITKQFWFKDALSSTLSFLLWILRKEKRIPHISPPVFDIFAAIAASLLVQLKQPQWKISSLIQQTGLSLQYQRAQLT